MTEEEVDIYIESMIADVCGDCGSDEIDRLVDDYYFNPEMGIYE